MVVPNKGKSAGNRGGIQLSRIERNKRGREGETAGRDPGGCRARRGPEGRNRATRARLCNIAWRKGRSSEPHLRAKPAASSGSAGSGPNLLQSNLVEDLKTPSPHPARFRFEEIARPAIPTPAASLPGQEDASGRFEVGFRAATSWSATSPSTMASQCPSATRMCPHQSPKPRVRLAWATRSEKAGQRPFR